MNLLKYFFFLFKDQHLLSGPVFFSDRFELFNNDVCINLMKLFNKMIQVRLGKEQGKKAKQIYFFSTFKQNKFIYRTVVD